MERDWEARWMTRQARSGGPWPQAPLLVTVNGRGLHSSTFQLNLSRF